MMMLLELARRHGTTYWLAEPLMVTATNLALLPVACMVTDVIITL